MKKCLNCGKEFELSKYHPKEHTFCSKKCRAKYDYKNNKERIRRKAQRYYKENKDKIISKSYSSLSIKLLGEACQRCGALKRVETHHKDGNRNNNPKDGSNWVRLCRKCHMEVDGRMKDWKKIRIGRKGPWAGKKRPDISEQNKRIFTGRPRREDLKKRQSELMKRYYKEGKIKPPSPLGRKHTEETKRKMSKLAKEIWKLRKLAIKGCLCK